MKKIHKFRTVKKPHNEVIIEAKTKKMAKVKIRELYTDLRFKYMGFEKVVESKGVPVYYSRTEVPQHNKY